MKLFWRSVAARRRRRGAQLVSAVAVALSASALLASAAFANGTVWLNWVYMNGGTTDQWNEAHHLNYVEAEPKTYENGACANAQINNKEYFSFWWCSNPKEAQQSTYMYGTYLFAQAYNKAGNETVWAWAGWS